MKYPLEQLATIKQKKLEEAERVLQEKKEALKQEEAKLASVEKERDKVKKHKDDKLTQLRQKLDEGTSTDKIQQMKEYLKVVVEQLAQKETKVKEQKKQVETAKGHLEAARKDLLQKQQDVEKLNLHRKEWEKEMQALLLHEESIETDELGSGMHVRKKQSKRKKNNHHS